MLDEMRELGIIVTATKYGLNTETKEGMLMAKNTLNMAEWDNQIGLTNSRMAAKSAPELALGYRNRRSVIIRKAKAEIRGATSTSKVNYYDMLSNGSWRVFRIKKFWRNYLHVV